MDDEGKKLIAQVQAELQAIRLITQEAISIALSHETDPDRAVSLARGDVAKILDETDKQVKKTKNADFRTWFCRLVRKSVEAQFDVIEKRVSTLTRGRITH